MRIVGEQPRGPKYLGIEQRCKHCWCKDAGSGGDCRENAGGDIYGKSKREYREWKASEISFEKTSLNMPGFSITLLLLPQQGDGAITKDRILQLLDAPAKTPAWTWTSTSPPKKSDPKPSHSNDGELGQAGTGNNVPVSEQFTESIRRACNALIQAEPEITRMDQVIQKPFLLSYAYLTCIRSQVTVIVVPHSRQGQKVRIEFMGKKLVAVIRVL